MYRWTIGWPAPQYIILKETVYKQGWIKNDEMKNGSVTCQVVVSSKVVTVEPLYSSRHWKWVVAIVWPCTSGHSESLCRQSVASIRGSFYQGYLIMQTSQPLCISTWWSAVTWGWVAYRLLPRGWRSRQQREWALSWPPSGWAGRSITRFAGSQRRWQSLWQRGSLHRYSLAIIINFHCWLIFVVEGKAKIMIDQIIHVQCVAFSLGL